VLPTRKLQIEHFTGVGTRIKDVKIAEGNFGQTKCYWRLKRMSVFGQVERNKESLRSILGTFVTAALSKIDTTSLFEFRRCESLYLGDIIAYLCTSRKTNLSSYGEALHSSLPICLCTYIPSSLVSVILNDVLTKKAF
jgi:hypothetical protein